MIPENDMGGLPFGAVLGAGSPAYCTDSFCVPKPVRDPYGLCMAVQQDASLLHGMKRKLMSVVRPRASAPSSHASGEAMRAHARLHAHRLWAARSQRVALHAMCPSCASRRSPAAQLRELGAERLPGLA